MNLGGQILPRTFFRFSGADHGSRNPWGPQSVWWAVGGLLRYGQFTADGLRLGTAGGENSVVSIGGDDTGLEVGIGGGVESLLRFGSDVRYDRPRVWHLDQIRPFLENPDAQGPDLIARYYGSVYRESEQARWKSRGLAYGLIELFPGTVANEWVTFPGHVHRGPGRVFLPSVAEVLHGTGGVYLQGVGSRFRESTVIWLEPGDRIVLPPAFVHALINRGSEPFILAEVHSARTDGDFTEVARHRGMGFYFGPEGYRANPHYRDLEMVREVSAASMGAIKTPGRDLYQAVLHNADRFRILDPFHGAQPS